MTEKSAYEAELYLIRQRMLSGRLAKAERGELAVPLPIGYVRRPSGEAVLDPDEQAPARGPAGLHRLQQDRDRQRSAALPRRPGDPASRPDPCRPSKGELEWRRPTRETLQNMLHNPVYAGYFAWGRRQVDQRRKAPGRPSTGRVVKDSAEWLVLLPGRLPAYITEQEFAANVARIAANQQTAAAPGAPRDGAALLSGLLRCCRCGAPSRAESATPTATAREGRARCTATRARSTRPTTVPAGHAGTSPAGARAATSRARCWKRWRRPRWGTMAAASQAEDERAMLGKLAATG